MRRQLHGLVGDPVAVFARLVVAQVDGPRQSLDGRVADALQLGDLLPDAYRRERV